MTTPKLATSDFLPGLTEEHVVGQAGVGINLISATLACNTAQTNAEIVAGPPNTVAAACGPIVHSLKQAPGFVQIENKMGTAELTGMSATVQFQYLTADNSAVYYSAKTWTGAVPLGVSVQVAVWPPG